jgi:lipopolysaccharide/colanic/teichoic acid biosynthesis glycosyltransferase
MRESTASRAFDIAAAAILLVVGLPVMALVALCVLIVDGAPVLYRATRVAPGGRTFVMLKFRTMIRTADRHGPITGKADHRTTLLGRVLRKLKVDELPQLINVLRGEMAIVGPRPEDPMLAARYPDWARDLLEMRPGITSPASVAYRDEQRTNQDGDVDVYEHEVLPRKLKIDVDYFKTRTLLSDVGVIARSVIPWTTMR